MHDSISNSNLVLKIRYGILNIVDHAFMNAEVIHRIHVGLGDSSNFDRNFDFSVKLSEN